MDFLVVAGGQRDGGMETKLTNVVGRARGQNHRGVRQGVYFLREDLERRRGEQLGQREPGRHDQREEDEEEKWKKELGRHSLYCISEGDGGCALDGWMKEQGGVETDATDEEGGGVWGRGKRDGGKVDRWMSEEKKVGWEGKIMQGFIQYDTEEKYGRWA